MACNTRPRIYEEGLLVKAENNEKSDHRIFGAKIVNNESADDSTCNMVYHGRQDTI